MPDRKVLQFGTARGTAAKMEALNPDLFGSAEHGRGKIAFISIDGLVEETFMRLIARNAVTAIVDLRPRPVFGRPHFQHKRIVNYFFQRRIRYVEYALLNPVRDAQIFIANCADETLRIALENILGEGLTICLYDEGSRQLGWLEQFRQLIRSTSAFGAEMNPRSLIGNPAFLPSR